MDRLPAETLIAIFRQASYKTLFQLCLVSRQVRELAEPILYRGISLHLVNRLSVRGTQPCSNAIVLDRLIEKLTKDGSTAWNVRALSLAVSNSPMYAGHWYRKWEQLLALVPRLRRIRLGSPPFDMDLTQFRELSHIEIDFRYFLDRQLEERQHSTLKRNFTRILLISSIRKLRVAEIRLSDSKGHWEIPEEKRRSSRITDLSVSSSIYGDLCRLPQITETIQALLHFTFEGQAEKKWNRYYSGEPGAYAPNIARAISYHTDTLESLNITFSEKDGGSLPLNFGHLRRCFNLRSLAIPAIFLTDRHDLPIHHSLPVGLERLQVQYPVRHHAGGFLQRRHSSQQLKLFAHEKSAWVPHLKQFIWWHQELNLPPYPHHHFTLDLVGLPELFANVDVHFRAFTSPQWADTLFAMQAEKGFGSEAFRYTGKEDQCCEPFRGHWVDIPAQESQ